MPSAEVVVHEVQRDGVCMVLDLLAEGIRQSGEPPHLQGRNHCRWLLARELVHTDHYA